MILLIDFSNLVWASFFGSLKYTKYEPETCPLDYTGHVDFFHQKLVKILQDVSCSQYLFVLDHKPHQKYTIFPDYKKSRKKLQFDPKPAVIRLLEVWQAQVVHSEGCEADDVIASYVADNLDTPITVATTDKDLWQLLENDKTKIYNFIKNSFVTKRELDEVYGVDSFAKIKLHKTLWGDSGDNVPNLIPRMQKPLIPYIIQSDGTLDHFWKVVTANWGTLSDRCQNLLTDNKDSLKINYQLVRLNFDCSYKIETASAKIFEKKKPVVVESDTDEFMKEMENIF